MKSLNLIESELETVLRPRELTREHEIKRVIEALLFASNEPLSVEKIREVVESTFPIRSKELKQLIEQLAAEYRTQKRGFQIDFIAGGYLLRSDPAMRPYIQQLLHDRRGEKLSHAATEVLAIIAYRGPITRRAIDKLRGVDCSGTMASLQERGLIEETGRLEAPGRPVLYGVSQKFLHHFGINHPQELLKETQPK